MKWIYNERVFYCSASFLYFSLCILKMRKYFLNGRFWAEEGSVFYADIAELSWIDGLFYIYYGHLEIITNIVVLLSFLVDLKYAPLVTTYLSLILQALPLLLIIVYYKNIGLSKIAVFALILIAAALPQASEVWTNSINLHFHFSLLVGVISLIEIKTNFQKWLFRILLVLSGLSGIPANFLMPAFLVSWTRTKNKEALVQFFILLSTSIIQLLIIFFSSFEVGDRVLTFNPLLYWYPILSQEIFSPLFGSSTGGRLADILATAVNFKLTILFFAVFCSIPIYYFVKFACQSSDYRFIVIAFAVITLSVLSLAFSLGQNKAELISSLSGGRYFYASNVLIMLYILLAYQKTKNRFIFFLIIFLTLSSIGRVNRTFSGPDWSQAYQTAIETNSPVVNIWPRGSIMNIPTSKNK